MSPRLQYGVPPGGTPRLGVDFLVGPEVSSSKQPDLCFHGQKRGVCGACIVWVETATEAT